MVRAGCNLKCLLSGPTFARIEALRRLTRSGAVVNGFRFVCVFHAKPATDSRASLPPIPDEGCH